MSLVCDCLKYMSILNEVLDLCSLQSSDKRLKKNRELAIVVLHRHLFGKGLNGCYAKFKVPIYMCIHVFNDTWSKEVFWNIATDVMQWYELDNIAIDYYYTATMVGIICLFDLVDKMCTG